MPEPTAPTVLLIAAPDSYRTASYLAAAQALGVRCVLAAESEYLLPGPLAGGIRLLPHEPAAALPALLQAARGTPFRAVIGTDDLCQPLASATAKALGLPHNEPIAAQIARRKDLARATLQRAGARVPWWRVIDLTADLASQLDGVPYPCVIKPVALSASRGVIRADDAGALMQAIARVRPLLADVPVAEERERVLVEAFIPAREYALEGLLTQGALAVLALFDKPDPLDGPHFEETYYVTPARIGTELAAELAACVQAACAAYGLRTGPVHAELRVNADGVFLLELASRTIGGLCGQLLRFEAGWTLEMLVLAHALEWPLQQTRVPGASGVLMIPSPAGILRRVEGVLEAQKVPGIEEVAITVRAGYRLLPPPDGGSYLGFIFARGGTPEAVEQALRAAHACLRIVVAPYFSLAQRA